MVSVIHHSSEMDCKITVFCPHLKDNQLKSCVQISYKTLLKTFNASYSIKNI